MNSLSILIILNFLSTIEKLIDFFFFGRDVLCHFTSFWPRSLWREFFGFLNIFLLNSNVQIEKCTNHKYSQKWLHLINHPSDEKIEDPGIPEDVSHPLPVTTPPSLWEDLLFSSWWQKMCHLLIFVITSVY